MVTGHDKHQKEGWVCHCGLAQSRNSEDVGSNPDTGRYIVAWMTT